MKRKIIFLLCFAIPLFCMAENLPREYEYDAAGNRTSRKVVNLPPQFTPPPSSPPEDPILAEHSIETEEGSLSPTSQLFPEPTTSEAPPKYFIEKIAQVEMKIYPNPTTENITLEIAGWKDLQTGIFKLYSLTGQLLQEQPVHAVTTTISLAGLSQGAYILKVHINNHTEDWKVIKH